MKIIYSEGPAQYQDYTFNYAVYAIPTNEELDLAYSMGFLPYTGNLSLEQCYFYLCRSLRIDLNKFEINSENKRVFKKIDPENVKLSVLTVQEFLENKSAIKFCFDYIRERFPEKAMTEERFQYILNILEGLEVYQLEFQGRMIAYILIVQGEKSAHYWFSFYSLDLSKEIPVGKFSMTYMINHFKTKALDYLYLGTCYGTKSLYKARDYKGMEYFDGAGWNNSLQSLKVLCKNDEIPRKSLTDQLKMNNFDLK